MEKHWSLASTTVITIAFVCMAGAVNAVEQNQADKKEARADKSVGKASQQEADYLAAVDKCEGMQPKEKQSCIESAKKRYGEMLR